MNDVSFEKKYLASSRNFPLGLSLLSHYCQKDPVHPYGLIHTIYFDTPRLQFYRDKQDGHFLKTKVRLRWYEEPSSFEMSEQIPAFLEIKGKIGSGRYKLRKKIDVEKKYLSEENLSRHQLRQSIYDHLHDLKATIPTNLFPTVKIHYTRHRFICPLTGSRVCIDHNIQATGINRKLLPGPSNRTLGDVVLEIKKSGLYDYPWMGNLTRRGFRYSQYSKYEKCLTLLSMGVAS